MKRLGVVWVLWWAASGVLLAGTPSGTVQSTRLYTAPDPTAAGGIRGRVLLPNAPLEDAFAVPQHDWSKVYRAELRADRKEFLFRGLPVGKYDLMLLFADEFYEGFTLTRDVDTLTDEDRRGIRETISRAVPFFDTKEVHRLAGSSGRDGRARGVMQELRTGLIITQAAEELKDTQIRSIKLVWLHQVGPGWQLVNTRELVRQEVAGPMRKGVLPHHYRARLGEIRVTDSVRDLGTLNLIMKDERSWQN